MNTTIEMATEVTENHMAAYYAYWKEITANNAKLMASDFLLHDLIRGRDPKKSGFSPITNKNKLANGCNAWDGLAKATNELYRGRFDPWQIRMMDLSKSDPKEIIKKTGEIKTR